MRVRTPVDGVEATPPVAREIRREQLRALIFEDPNTMGAAAAAYVADRLRVIVSDKGEARMIFAAATSQSEFLAHLASADGVDWARVTAFQLDEYVGLPLGDPRTFSRWLDNHIWTQVRPGRVERLNGNASDLVAECSRYGELITAGGLDLALIGIGENGHVAFNEPAAADFADPLQVKVVDIDEASRTQQVHDGAFGTSDAVPRIALSVTMSTILASRAISAFVPGRLKAHAVAAALDGPIDESLPASGIRRHPDAVLFADTQAMSLVLP